MQPRGDVTQLLADLSAGREEAREKLIPLVYRELHDLAGRFMRRQSAGHTLQTTALVHEAYLRLGGDNETPFENRAHFLRTAARAMRSILVDHDRQRRAQKRGGQAVREPLIPAVAFVEDPDHDLLDLDSALTRLSAIDPKVAQVVELRFFGGLTIEEAARVMEVSARTVTRDWTLARGLAPERDVAGRRELVGLNRAVHGRSEVMTSEEFVRTKQIFHSALELPPEERSEFLERSCGDDPRLRNQVEALLAAHDGSDAFIDSLLPVDVLPDPVAATLVGAHVGQYELKQIISSGGMGTVFEARQAHPSRTVAVKVMKPGVLSRSTWRRFEAEAQILANLHHPGIAQVHEAGTHTLGGPDAGQLAVPYYAMEYVEGAKSLTDFAHDRELDTNARLDLFLQVLDAVHHGHQRGVIHRDLKPGNILVDDTGRVKVIDFGVARATDSDVLLTTQHTDPGQLIGTVQYMSPEQCRADLKDLDVRSDVYALGVVLYELLCGELPYDIRDTTVLEATRRILEEPVRRPSTTVKTLRGDIETILLKALEKERDRRYRSADAMRRDIASYLAGEPITARPPSTLYQLRFFARRHRGVLGGLVVAFVMLIVGLIVSTTLYFNARAAARTSERVNQFYAQMLASLDPMQVSWMRDADWAMPPVVRGEEPDELAANMIIGATNRIEGTFQDEPLTEADVRETLGMTLIGLGRYAEAEEQLTAGRDIRHERLGSEHRDTLRSQTQLSRVFMWQGRIEDATTLGNATLAIMRSTLGENDLDTQTCAAHLAGVITYVGRMAEAEALYDRAFELFDRSPEKYHRRKVFFLVERARGLAGLRPEKADSLTIRAFEISRGLGEKEGATIFAEVLYGFMLLRNRKDEEARELLRATVEKSRSGLGETNKLTLRAKLALAQALQRTPETFEERKQLLRKTLEEFDATISPGAPTHALTWFAYLELLCVGGEYDEAVRLSRERARVCLDELAPENWTMWDTLRDVADLLWGREQCDESCNAYLESFESLRATFGDAGGMTIDAVNVCARRLRAADRSHESRQLLEEHLSRLRRAAEAASASPFDLSGYALLLLTAEDPTLRNAASALAHARRAVDAAAELRPWNLEILALALEQNGLLAEARATQQRAVEVCSRWTWRRRVGELHKKLARLHFLGGDAARGMEVFHRYEQIEVGIPVYGARREYPTALATDVLMLLEVDQPALALERAERGVEFRRSWLDERHWKQAEARSLLGAALLSQGEYAEAEPTLLEAYDALSRHPIAFDELERTRQWLVELYESQGKPEQAELWRNL